MGWTNSRIFVTFLEDCLENTAAYDLNLDAIKVALYSTSATPDNTVTTANRAYGVGQWVSGASGSNECYDGAEWPQTGQALGSVTCATAAAVLTFDAADEVSTGTSVTLSGASSPYGCLIFDDDVGDSGICYNYFGGAQTVGGRLS